MENESTWIAGVLGSLDGTARASMPGRLQERLLQHLPPARTTALRRPAVWLMAAGIALLAGLNIYMLASRGQPDTAGRYTDAVAAEYFPPPPSI